jgi:hypothetical protein
MRIRAILAAALLLTVTSHAHAFGYYGDTFNTDSMLFGQAFGQLSPYYQANFGWYDGSNLVAMRNQFYDQWFGINSVPGGFSTVLNAFDNLPATILPSADPRNFYPPVFNQMTAMNVCIPQIPIPGVGC